MTTARLAGRRGLRSGRWERSRRGWWFDRQSMQAHWALFYYEEYGYWTSVNSALACWALVAADH